MEIFKYIFYFILLYSFMQVIEQIVNFISEFLTYIIGIMSLDLQDKTAALEAKYEDKDDEEISTNVIGFQVPGPNDEEDYDE